jgi:hypothetical protein
MIARSPRVAILLSTIIAFGTPLSTSPLAQTRNCAQVADRFDRAVKGLQDEADQKNIEFLHAQAMADTTASLKTLMANAPNATRAIEMKEKWDEVKAAREKMRTYQQVLADLQKCITPGSGCNLQNFVKEVTDEIRQWVEELTEAGLAAVSARVAEASEIVKTFNERAMNISTGTMSEMQACTDDFSRRAAQVTVEAAPTPSAAEPEEIEVPEPPSKPVEDSGGLSGTTILAGVALAGAGGYYLLDKSKSCTEPTTNFFSVCANQGGSSSACSTAREAQRAYCTCLGMGFSTSGGCTP